MRQKQLKPEQIEKIQKAEAFIKERGLVSGKELSERFNKNATRKNSTNTLINLLTENLLLYETDTKPPLYGLLKK